MLYLCLLLEINLLHTTTTMTTTTATATTATTITTSKFNCVNDLMGWCYPNYWSQSVITAYIRWQISVD